MKERKKGTVAIQPSDPHSRSLPTPTSHPASVALIILGTLYVRSATFRAMAGGRRTSKAAAGSPPATPAAGGDGSAPPSRPLSRRPSMVGRQSSTSSLSLHPLVAAWADASSEDEALRMREAEEAGTDELL